MKDFELSADLSKEELRTECQTIINTVTNNKLPQIIRNEIQRLVNNTFTDYRNTLFAVRSSAASEDSEEMSAAGQMTTFLGVRGLDDICESVMKFWSSQFSHIAVEYKRGYGQPINGPMDQWWLLSYKRWLIAILRELCSLAIRSLETRDLLRSQVTMVCANQWVSASAEPDTIRLSVNIESNTLSNPRTVRAIEKKTIGSKKMSIKLNESGGTFEEEISERQNCCLSDEVVLRLAHLGLIIHKH